MTKYRIKIALQKWSKLSSGYEVFTPGVDIMFMTIEAENIDDARNKARERLIKAKLDGILEDIERVKDNG